MAAQEQHGIPTGIGYMEGDLPDCIVICTVPAWTWSAIVADQADAVNSRAVHYCFTPCTCGDHMGRSYVASSAAILESNRRYSGVVIRDRLSVFHTNAITTRA